MKKEMTAADNMVNKSGLWKFVEYVVYAFYILFPFIMYKSFLFTGSSTRSANLIFITAILGIILSIWLMKKENRLDIPKSPILLALGLYFVSVCISAFVGLNPEASFWSVVTRTTGIWYLIHLGTISLLLVALVTGRERQKKLIFFIITSTVLYSLLAFLSPEGVGLLFHGYESEGFTFGNSSFGAMYIFGAFLLSIYYIVQASMKKWWMYALPILLVINPFILNKKIFYGDFSEGLLGIARTSSYAVAFSVIALVCMWLISKILDQKRRSIVTYGIFGIGLIGVALASISLLSSDGYIRKAYLARSTAARPLVWELSEKVIAQRPFFGWGMDNFERVFELNYDNRLLQNEYGNEAWFDRAHNVFIDQAVDNGIVGLSLYILAYIVIILCLIYVTLRSGDKNDRILASILIVYFSLHFFEVQTAFDTSISYPMIAVMIALAVVLYQRTKLSIVGIAQEFTVKRSLTYIAAGIMFIYFIWSLVWGWWPFVRAEMTNGSIRLAGDSTKRVPLYPVLFDSPVDEHAFLWRTSTDFKMAIGSNPKLIEDVEKRSQFSKEILIFEQEYRKIVEENPLHFRAHLNLADMLIYEQIFEINKLADAQLVLDDAIKLVPQAPQSYWMKAVAYLYMKKFDLAREYAKKGLDLNPDIKESQRVVNYIEKSIKTFPNIELYNFKQL